MPAQFQEEGHSMILHLCKKSIPAQYLLFYWAAASLYWYFVEPADVSQNFL